MDVAFFIRIISIKIAHIYKSWAWLRSQPSPFYLYIGLYFNANRFIAAEGRRSRLACKMPFFAKQLLTNRVDKNVLSYKINENH